MFASRPSSDSALSSISLYATASFVGCVALAPSSVSCFHTTRRLSHTPLRPLPTAAAAPMNYSTTDACALVGGPAEPLSFWNKLAAHAAGFLFVGHQLVCKTASSHTSHCPLDSPIGVALRQENINSQPANLSWLSGLCHGVFFVAYKHTCAHTLTHDPFSNINCCISPPGTSHLEFVFIHHLAYVGEFTVKGGGAPETKSYCQEHLPVNARLCRLARPPTTVARSQRPQTTHLNQNTDCKTLLRNTYTA